MAEESLRPAAVAILSRILAQLQRGEVQIPAVPAVVTELRELVDRSDSRLDVIVTLLERDPALVARVIQLGRSAQYGRPSGPGTPDLHYIITRIGFRQLGNVVETVWANGCFAIADEHYQPCVERLTRRSVARAVAMRALAERLRIEVARQRVQSSSEAIERVAETTGFRDPERMRRAFIRAFGQPPQSLRRAARAG